MCRSLLWRSTMLLKYYPGNIDSMEGWGWEEPHFLWVQRMREAFTHRVPRHKASEKMFNCWNTDIVWYSPGGKSITILSHTVSVSDSVCFFTVCDLFSVWHGSVKCVWTKWTSWKRCCIVITSFLFLLSLFCTMEISRKVKIWLISHLKLTVVP